jgi:hypothetical protein
MALTITLNWVDSISPGATGVKIYRDDIEIGDVPVGTQQFQDDTAVETTRYKYEVQAYNAETETTLEVPEVNVQYITTEVEYDDIYQAWLDQLEGYGYGIPTLLQQIVQNEVIENFRSDGILDELDYFLFSAQNGSREAAKVNVMNPLMEATEVGVLTWSPNIGFQGNDVDSYLDTGYNPIADGINFLQDTASFFLYVSLQATGFDYREYVGGYGPDLFSAAILSRYDDNVATYINSDQFIQATEVDIDFGFFHVNRDSVTSYELFREGLQISSGNDASTGVANVNMYVGATNRAGVPSYINDCQWGIVGFGGNLTSQAVRLNEIIQNYIISI